MGSRGRGGYQKPARPAAVSGPGAMSARTDGGPAQPVPEYTGHKYGENQALNNQASAAPIAASPTPAAQSTQGAPVRPMQDPWRPTEHPNEPITAGARLGPGPGLDDPKEDTRALIAAMYEMFGDDELRQILEHL